MTELTHTQTTVQTVIEELHYDFDSFVMDDFLCHVEKQRSRPLTVHYIPLKSELFGFWYPTERADYIFVNANLHLTHRIHTTLHEIAHMLLGHRGVNLRELLGEDLAHELGILSGEGHLRAAVSIVPVNRLQEQEAELFVFLIHRKLVTAQRLHELYGEPTSIISMQPYVRSLDFNS